MENAILDLYVSDWWISIYVKDSFGLDVHVWVPAAILLVLAIRKIYRRGREAAKLQPKPLLGVVRPKDEDGKR